MNSPRILFLLLLLVSTSDWPQFCGPTGQGVSDEQGLPLTWSETKNVRWKAAKLANPKNSLASPTPIVEGDRVYVHFGPFGTACITQAGEIVWKTKLEYDNGQHGTGGSPVLYEDLLIISCDGNDVQFVVALDKLTGKVRWKKSREGYQAYTTPLIVELAGSPQVISPGAFRAISYDPRNGKE